MPVESNAAEVAAALRAVGPRIGDELTDAHAAAARLVLASARPPRRTGRLAESARPAWGPAESTVVYDVRYARPVHKLQPWIPRAIDDARDDVAQLFRDALVDAVRTAT